MDFVEAMKLLKNGKQQVRRKAWANKNFRLIRHGDDFASMGGSRNMSQYTVKLEDTQADDWEIFGGRDMQSAIRTSEYMPIHRMTKPELVLTKEDYQANDWAVCSRKT